jgi:hypothetical protein
MVAELPSQGAKGETGHLAGFYFLKGGASENLGGVRKFQLTQKFCFIRPEEEKCLQDVFWSQY